MTMLDLNADSRQRELIRISFCAAIADGVDTSVLAGFFADAHALGEGVPLPDAARQQLDALAGAVDGVKTAFRRLGSTARAVLERDPRVRHRVEAARGFLEGDGHG